MLEKMIVIKSYSELYCDFCGDFVKLGVYGGVLVLDKDWKLKKIFCNDLCQYKYNKKHT